MKLMTHANSTISHYFTLFTLIKSLVVYLIVAVYRRFDWVHIKFRFFYSTMLPCISNALNLNIRVIRVGKFAASKISSTHMRSNKQYLLETLPQNEKSKYFDMAIQEQKAKICSFFIIDEQYQDKSEESDIEDITLTYVTALAAIRFVIFILLLFCG